MENISNINQTSPVYFNQPNFKGNVDKTVTKPDMKEDGDKKLKKALIALGALGAAGVGLYALHKTGKLDKLKSKLNIGNNKAGTQITDNTNNVSDAIKSKPSKVHNASQTGIKDMSVEKRIETAREQIQEGVSNNSIKNNGITTNLPHERKKQIKEIMKQAHSAETTKEQLANKEAIKNAKKVQKTASQAQKSYQALNSNQGKAKEVLDSANNAVEVAQKKANEAVETAEKLGTRKAKQWATRANNEAMELQNKAQKVEQKTTQILNGFAQQDDKETVNRFVNHLAKMENKAPVHPNKVLKSLEKNKENLTPETYDYLKTQIKKLIKQFNK